MQRGNSQTGSWTAARCQCLMLWAAGWQGPNWCAASLAQWRQAVSQSPPLTKGTEAIRNTGRGKIKWQRNRHRGGRRRRRRWIQRQHFATDFNNAQFLSQMILYNTYHPSIPVNSHIPVYSLKHFPGRFRPALPALWLADALEMGVTTSDSMAVRGLYARSFTNAQSMTNTTPFIVMEVSAMLVATTTWKKQKSGMSQKRHYFTGLLHRHRFTCNRGQICKSWLYIILCDVN